jgi:hypothetical protein
VVESLPSKNEALTSDPSTTKNKRRRRRGGGQEREGKGRKEGRKEKEIEVAILLSSQGCYSKFIPHSV